MTLPAKAKADSCSALSHVLRSVLVICHAFLPIFAYSRCLCVCEEKKRTLRFEKKSKIFELEICREIKVDDW